MRRGWRGLMWGCTFMMNNGKATSCVPSREDEEDVLEDPRPDVLPSETVMERDQRRSVLSHVIDIRYLYHLEPGHPLLSASCGYVKVARIIPIERKAKLEHSASADTVLGRTDIFEDLDSDNLENMMSLHVPVHHFLDSFAICLTAVEGQPDMYRIEGFHPLVLKDIPKTPVTFTNTPLPRPSSGVCAGRVSLACGHVCQ
ncbi:hypothetical protein EV421DRAFT_986655 [Armillaria borealis]|uniref:Uncharacterized protein n=1 Tax=Armillaria borealis TaxID=47425 RepID=A0AA39J9A3_9AGAR|nr:hypothetical protein EV421DRAFT_986655 [Armillaria borealis]